MRIGGHAFKISMHKQHIRIVSLLLIPALLMDPVTCHGMAGLPFAGSIGISETSLTLQQRFEAEAITAPILNFALRSYARSLSIRYYAEEGALLLAAMTAQVGLFEQTLSHLPWLLPVLGMVEFNSENSGPPEDKKEENVEAAAQPPVAPAAPVVTPTEVPTPPAITPTGSEALANTEKNASREPTETLGPERPSWRQTADDKIISNICQALGIKLPEGKADEEASAKEQRVIVQGRRAIWKSLIHAEPATWRAAINAVIETYDGNTEHTLQHISQLLNISAGEMYVGKLSWYLGLPWGMSINELYVLQALAQNQDNSRNEALAFFSRSARNTTALEPALQSLIAKEIVREVERADGVQLRIVEPSLNTLKEIKVINDIAEQAGISPLELAVLFQQGGITVKDVKNGGIPFERVAWIMIKYLSSYLYQVRAVASPPSIWFVFKMKNPKDQNQRYSLRVIKADKGKWDEEPAVNIPSQGLEDPVLPDLGQVDVLMSTLKLDTVPSPKGMMALTRVIVRQLLLAPPVHGMYQVNTAMENWLKASEEGSKASDESLTSIYAKAYLSADTILEGKLLSALSTYQIENHIHAEDLRIPVLRMTAMVLAEYNNLMNLEKVKRQAKLADELLTFFMAISPEDYLLSKAPIEKPQKKIRQVVTTPGTKTGAGAVVKEPFKPDPRNRFYPKVVRVVPTPITSLSQLPMRIDTSAEKSVDAGRRIRAVLSGSNIPHAPWPTRSRLVIFEKLNTPEKRRLYIEGLVKTLNVEDPEEKFDVFASRSVDYPPRSWIDRKAHDRWVKSQAAKDSSKTPAAKEASKTPASKEVAKKALIYKLEIIIKDGPDGAEGGIDFTIIDPSRTRLAQRISVSIDNWKRNQATKKALKVEKALQAEKEKAAAAAAAASKLAAQLEAEKEPGSHTRASPSNVKVESPGLDDSLTAQKQQGQEVKVTEPESQGITEITAKNALEPAAEQTQPTTVTPEEAAAAENAISSGWIEQVAVKRRFTPKIISPIYLFNKKEPGREKLKNRWIAAPESEAASIKPEVFDQISAQQEGSVVISLRFTQNKLRDRAETFIRGFVEALGKRDAYGNRYKATELREEEGHLKSDIIVERKGDRSVNPPESGSGSLGGKHPIWQPGYNATELWFRDKGYPTLGLIMGRILLPDIWESGFLSFSASIVVGMLFYHNQISFSNYGTWAIPLLVWDAGHLIHPNFRGKPQWFEPFGLDKLLVIALTSAAFFEWNRHVPGPIGNLPLWGLLVLPHLAILSSVEIGKWYNSYRRQKAAEKKKVEGPVKDATTQNPPVSQKAASETKDPPPDEAKKENEEPSSQSIKMPTDDEMEILDPGAKIRKRSEETYLSGVKSVTEEFIRSLFMMMSVTLSGRLPEVRGTVARSKDEAVLASVQGASLASVYKTNVLDWIDEIEKKNSKSITREQLLKLYGPLEGLDRTIPSDLGGYISSIETEHLPKLRELLHVVTLNDEKGNPNYWMVMNAVDSKVVIAQLSGRQLGISKAYIAGEESEFARQFLTSDSQNRVTQYPGHSGALHRVLSWMGRSWGRRQKENQPPASKADAAA
jgi:hypothetical protein